MNKIKQIIFAIIDKVFAFLPEDGSKKWGLDRRIIKSFIKDMGRTIIATTLAGLIAIANIIEIPESSWYYSIWVAVIAMIIRFLQKIYINYSKK